MAVTKTNNLRKGSKGNDVLELQRLLNKNGYSLAEDGSFGGKTLDAVKDYQAKNGLSVDGIVGTNTWGKLTGSGKSSSSGTTTKSTANPTTPSASATGIVPDYAKYSYDASGDEAYMQAVAALKAVSGDMPTYNDTYDQQALDAFNKIMNKEAFSYDVNKDALYQQLKDQYTTQGKLASMDVMGQAAAMNGGYGSSYAQSVGQQAYQGYLQQLNEAVPELHQMAYGQYTQEVQDLYDQYGLISGLAKDEYTKYQNDLDLYWKRVSDLKDDVDTAYDRGFNNWYTSVTLGNEADETAYKRQQDTYNNLVNLITVSGYVPSAEELEAAGMSAEQAKALKTYYTNSLTAAEGSGKTGKGADNGNVDGSKPANQTITSKANNGNVKDADIRAMQNKLGVTVDGRWGPKSQEAALKMWGTTSADEAFTKYQENGGDGGKKPTATDIYNEAIKYLEDNGIDSGVTSRLMDLSEWSARRDQGNKDAYGDTYEDYVEEFLKKNKGKGTTTTRTGTTTTTATKY